MKILLISFLVLASNTLTASAQPIANRYIRQLIAVTHGKGDDVRKDCLHESYTYRVFHQSCERIIFRIEDALAYHAGANDIDNLILYVDKMGIVASSGNARFYDNTMAEQFRKKADAYNGISAQLGIIKQSLLERAKHWASDPQLYVKQAIKATTEISAIVSRNPGLIL